jgi:hypothetical protein
LPMLSRIISTPPRSRTRNGAGGVGHRTSSRHSAYDDPAAYGPGLNVPCVPAPTLVTNRSVGWEVSCVKGVHPAIDRRRRRSTPRRAKASARTYSHLRRGPDTPSPRLDHPTLLPEVPRSSTPSLQSDTGGVR